MKFPKTLREFREEFPNEEACWNVLRHLRWPRGVRCPRCGHHKSYPNAGRCLEQCQSCRYQASITVGTIFHKTRVPLRICFLGILFVARHKQGISALQFQRDTGPGSYQTDRTRSAEILPWSHTIFSNLKSSLLGTFRGLSKKHMPRYLAEFIYRFNRRWREGGLFVFVISRAVRGEPFPYSRIAAELLG